MRALRARSSCPWRVLAALLAVFSPLALSAADAPPRTYVSPWVVVKPEARQRVDALPALPPAALSPNAPGLLLEVGAGHFGDAAALAAMHDLAAAAHRAGWRYGLSVTLTAVPVPTDARAAEVASGETLYPGLGRLLQESRGADLYELHFDPLAEDPRSETFVLRKLAAEAKALSPAAAVAASFNGIESGVFPAATKPLLTDVTAAYVDLVGVRLAAPVAPAKVREAADALAFGRPVLVRLARLASADALLAQAAAGARSGIPYTAAELDSAPEADATLLRFGLQLNGDFSTDARAATVDARGAGAPLDPSQPAPPVFRFVSGTDLGGVLLVPADQQRGAVSLTLDAPSYTAAEVVELATGRSKSFEIPRGSQPPRLTLSTASGSIAVRLTAREKAPAEGTRTTVGVAAERGLTAEEILARHQAWRARRDARWTRFIARNETSIRYRFADLNNTLDQTLSGLFFYERGKGFDWVWNETYFNGVRWRGKKVPELPLVQPEKVSELPLALTFTDAYTYKLNGQDTVNGVKVYALDFEPKETVSVRAVYAGRVFISTSDFALIRTVTRQLNLEGEVQSVDETTDFDEVQVPGGEPIRFPTKLTGQWILRTFSRTTVLERETRLIDIRIDPAAFEDERKAALDSKETIVRDTDKGLRYLEKNKAGERVVVEDAKTSRMFGLAGVFYDTSLDYPLPLLGVYYLDLNFRKKHQQAQVFFGGVLLAVNFNEPSLFGTKLDFGVDLFGIAVRGTDSFYVNGEEDESQRVKQRTLSGNLNVGYPITRHLKLSAQLGFTHRSFAEADETAPDFALPTSHLETRLRATAIYDVQGWALSTRFAYNTRSSWDFWGRPGNPDYDPDKDTYQNWAVQLSKDFHFAKFRRLRTNLAYFGSSNTDRFSKYNFGFFGGTSLRGFRSNALRAETAFVGRLGYGVVVGDTLRIEGIYDHAVIKDPASGLDWDHFGGAGLSGQFPGPWTTMVQLDAGIPVVGRDKGQKGFVINLVFLKIF